jgi:tetratricopeptide (TPR) repeat protein
MQEESTPAPGLAQLGNEAKAETQAEELELIGTAYGRRDEASSIPEASTEPAVGATDPAGMKTARGTFEFAKFTLPALDLDALLRTRALLAEHKHVVIGGLAFVLLALISTFAYFDLSDTSEPVNVTELRKPVQSDVSGQSAPAQEAVKEEATRRAEAERTILDIKAQLSEALAKRTETERTLNEISTKLSGEHETRASLEAKVAELSSTINALTQARDSAERTIAETRAQLEAERKARLEIEKGAQSANVRLTSARTESSDVPAPVTAPAAPAPVSAPAAPANGPSPALAKTADLPPPHDIAERAVQTSTRARLPVAANSALLKGQELFARGDLDAAREHFGQAAGMGMPEGALALGNTYDSVSLAKTGLKLAGDPERARQWYRRAFDLARRQR